MDGSWLLIFYYTHSTHQVAVNLDINIVRAALSLYYVLKYVGETALSGLLRFSAASLFRTKHNKL